MIEKSRTPVERGTFVQWVRKGLALFPAWYLLNFCIIIWNQKVKDEVLVSLIIQPPLPHFGFSYKINCYSVAVFVFTPVLGDFSNIISYMYILY